MKVKLLTPHEQRVLDPTDTVRLGLARFRHDRRSDLPSHLATKASPTQVIQQYFALAAPSLPQPYKELQADNVGKVGRQGGTFPLAQLQQLCARYYQRAEELGHQNLTIHPDLYRARDYLLAQIRDLIERTGGPQFYDFQPSSKKTAAALPCGGRKGTFDSETIGMSPWRHPLAVVPGERFMRNSPRSIFMVPNPDYRYQECSFTVVRNWLKSRMPEYFSAWVHPAEMSRAISALMRKPFISIEEDYVAMDVNFGLRVVQELIAPIYELLLGPRYIQWMAYVEESFSAPLYWGDRLWLGEHTLFSGLPYTNDFETIFSVIMMLASVLATRSIASFDGPILYLALGDDLTVASQFSPKRASVMHRKHLSYAMSCGMELHDDEKARISTTDLRFLRRVYYRGGYDFGAYPSVLALNNILQPEYLQPTVNLSIAADLQRLDGLYGAPDWEVVNAMYLRSLTDEARHWLKNNEELLKQTRLEQDWWDTLYGEVYQPMAGPAYAWLRARL